MDLTDRINQDLITAMKSGDKISSAVLRMLKSDLKYKEIELGRKLTEEDYLAVLTSAAKKRRDAIESFEKGGRDELASKEKAELGIVAKYLPEQIPDDKLEKLVKESVAQIEASTPADIGRVMKDIMPKVKGRVDGRKVKELVLNLLNS